MDKYLLTIKSGDGENLKQDSNFAMQMAGRNWTITYLNETETNDQIVAINCVKLDRRTTISGPTGAHNGQHADAKASFGNADAQGGRFGADLAP